MISQISCTANRFSWYSSYGPLLFARGFNALGRPPKRPRARAALQSRLRAFLDELPLKFRQGRKDMESQLATCRGRVNSFLQTLQAGALLLQPVHPCNQILDGAPEPIQAPHHERVPCTHEVLDLLQPRPLGHRTADPVDNDPSGTPPASRHLAGGRDADHGWRRVRIRCT